MWFSILPAGEGRLCLHEVEASENEGEPIGCQASTLQALSVALSTPLFESMCSDWTRACTETSTKLSSLHHETGGTVAGEKGSRASGC